MSESKATEVIEMARGEIERLRTMEYDPEEFHLAEDRLHRLILVMVAESVVMGDDAKVLAKIGLETLDMIDTRWYA